MESDYTVPGFEDVCSRVVLAILVLVSVFDRYCVVPLCQEQCSLGKEVCRCRCPAVFLSMISQKYTTSVNS
jgi:hypothetical protein